jgi:hypothetical protein
MKKLFYLLLLPTLCHATTHDVFVGKVFGRADDFSAFQSAIDFGKGDTTYVHMGPGVFNFSAKVQFHYSNVSVLSDSSVTTFVPTYTGSGTSPFICAYGSLVQTATVSIPVTSGANTFSWSGAASVSNTDILVLYGPVYANVINSTATYANGWFGVPNSHTSSTVTMNNTALETYTATTLKRYRPLTNIHLYGMRLDLSSWSAGWGVELRKVTNSSIDHCVLSGQPNASTGVTQGFIIEGDNVQIVNNNIHDFLYAYTGTSCYAINPEGHNVTVQNNTFYRVRVCIESGGRDYISRGMDYIGNRFDDITSVTLGFHGDSYGVVRDNIIHQKVFSLNGTNVGLKSISLRYFHGDVYNNFIYLDNTLNHTDRRIWMQENGYKDISIHDNWVIYKGGTASNNRFIGFGSLLGATSNIQVYNNHIWNGSIQLATDGSGTYSGVQIHDNDFYNYTIAGATGVTGSISPSSCAGCTFTTNKHFTGIAPPNESVLGTTPTPPSGGDTAVVVVPIPVDTTTNPDQPPVTPVQWKDTIPLSTSFTMPLTPKEQKYKWINTERGGMFNMPAPSNATSVGLVIYFWNYTGQPIEVNRTLYTRFASGRKRHSVPAVTQGVLFSGGSKVTVVGTKYKLEKI